MEDQENLARPMSIRCTVELRDSLEQLARKDQRPLSNYVRKILEDHVRDATAVKTDDEKAA